MLRPTRNLLGHELVPSFTGTFKGVPFRTNRWGMRDKEYDLTPATGTYRIALLGSSFTLGAGVPEELTHEALLEDRLNREGPGAPRRRFEILNFSAPRYGALQYVALTDTKVFQFAPQSLLFVIHSVEQTRIANHIILLLRAGTPINDPYLRRQLQIAGVRRDMKDPELKRRLRAVSLDLVRWSYKRIARQCRERGVRVVGILFDEPRRLAQDNRRQLAELASEEGIILLNLDGVYAGHSPDAVKLKQDVHLNVLGHKLVADRLYELLRDNDAQALQLGFARVRSPSRNR